MDPRIVGIVGPCSAGKSTLVAGLKRHGLQGKNIAQEHSYVADMWQRLSKPDVLIYLDVSFSEAMRRRKLNWNQAEFDEQINRLRHARQHADFYLHTDGFSIQEVLDKALDFLRNPGSASQPPL